jgi:hypothetical protein
MNCYSCNIKLQKKDRLCVDCKFDDDVTISKTDLKKIYKLTNEDIENENLYHFTVNRGSGKRFIIADVENLIEKLSDRSIKGNVISDSHHACLMKIKKEIDDEYEYVIMLNKKKKVVKDLLRTMIEKANYIEYIDQMKYLIDNDQYLDIDQYIDQENYDNYDEVCENILTSIERKAESLFELNKLIKKHHKNDYDRYMDVLINSNSVLYKKCIDQEIYAQPSYHEDGILKKLFNELKEKVAEKERDDRSNEIEELLLENCNDIHNNEYFYEYMRTNTKYKQYVEGYDLTLDDIIEKISRSIRLKVMRKERKDAINTKLGNLCSNSLVKKMISYKKYINNGVGEIDSVTNKITEDFIGIQKHKKRIEQSVMKKKCKIINRLEEITLQLINIGMDVNAMRKYIDDFEETTDDELLLEGFCGNELTFFNMMCNEKGFIYKRLNDNKISIKKTQ